MEHDKNVNFLPKSTMVKIAKEKANLDRIEQIAVEKFRIEAEKLLVTKWHEAHLHAIEAHPKKKTVCLSDVIAAFKEGF